MYYTVVTRNILTSHDDDIVNIISIYVRNPTPYGLTYIHKIQYIEL